MSLKDPQSLDEFIEYGNTVVAKFDEIIAKSDSQEKLAKLIIEADNPDKKFKAHIIMQMMEIIDKLKVVGRYLNQPVKMEGILQRKLDGTVVLNDTVVSSRSIVEFMQEDEWKAGILIQDPKTKQYSIRDIVNGDKVLVEKIEQIKARMR